MIRAIITDFDGTLVDTFEANFRAYSEAFQLLPCRELTRETYRKCFGLRFDCFMDTMNIMSPKEREIIREHKKLVYPKYFDLIKSNTGLVALIDSMRKDYGIKTAVASTARYENLIAALDYMNLTPLFDLIRGGESVHCGKPSPEIYLSTMEMLNVTSDETLIFEDSDVGIEAALTSKAHCIRVSQEWK